MIKLWNLRKLKLVSVCIEGEREFEKALIAMRTKLQHFELFEDAHTMEYLPQRIYGLVYQNLSYQEKIQTLKIMALKNNHNYKGLLHMKTLEKLSIISFKNNFLPKLYKTLLESSIKNINILEWKNPNTFKPLKPHIAEEKTKFIQAFPNHQSITHTEEGTRNKKYVTMEQ